MNSIIRPIIILYLISLTNIFQVIKLESVPELFTTDKLGNCYVYKNNLLVKLNVEGKILGQFTSFDSGTLFSVDASDPMQLLLFYKDFNQLILLDNKLNPIGTPLYFDKIDYSSVTAVCKSRQYGIWFYDEFENKLVHYGFNPKGVIQTINLDKYGKKLGSINFLLESGNEIYLRDKDHHVWYFDLYGGILNEMNINVIKDFQLLNKRIVYHNKHKMYSFNVEENTMDSVGIDGFSSFDNLRIENGKIYVLNSDSISIFTYSFKN